MQIGVFDADGVYGVSEGLVQSMLGCGCWVLSVGPSAQAVESQESSVECLGVGREGEGPSCNSIDASKRVRESYGGREEQLAGCLLYRCWMLDAGCWMLDDGRWTLDDGLWRLASMNMLVDLSG